MNPNRLRPWRIPLLLIAGSLLGWSALALVAWGTAAEVPDGTQNLPDLAYDSEQNCFLLNYQEFSGANFAVAAASFAEDGAAVDNVFEVADDSTDRNEPAVAFDPTTGNFLVTWSAGGNAQAQRVLGSGSTTGALISPVDDASVTVDNPHIAANTVSGGYLIAWRDDNDDLLARRIGAGGSLLGSEITVKASVGSTANLHVAYDPDNERYLVVFGDNTSTVEGRFVDANDGGVTTLAGGAIFSGSGTPRLPFVAHDPVNGRYFVVWWRNDTTEYVEGRLLNANGGQIGNIVTFTSNSPVSIPEPRVAFDPINEQYLAAWLDVDGTFPDVVGQLVDTDGEKVGNVVDLMADGAVQYQDPALAANSGEGGFLVAATNDTLNPDQVETAFFSGTVGGRGGGGAGPPWGGYALLGAGLAGLLLLGMSRQRRRLRPATATAVALVLLNVAVIGGVVACADSGGGGGGNETVEPCPL